MSAVSALADRLVRYTNLRGGGDGQYPTEIEPLTVARVSRPTAPVPTTYEPSVCVVVQGAKRVVVGETTLEADIGSRLVTGVEVPATGQFARASPEAPALSLVLTLDAALLLEVAATVDAVEMDGQGSWTALGMAVAPLNEPAAEVLVRLVGLLDRPGAIGALYPAFARELYYWLLVGPGGDQFARVALPSGHAEQVAEAVRRLRAAFPGPVDVRGLAEAVGMSLSAFYTHFKAVTGVAPLQYYKRLRLLEARRLLSAEGAGVAEAAFEVGYQSASQFSREYARAFGAPPGRHARRLRGADGAEAAA